MPIPASTCGDFSCPNCGFVNQSNCGWRKSYLGQDYPWKVTCVCDAIFQVSKNRVDYIASGRYGDFPRKPSPREMKYPPRVLPPPPIRLPPPPK